MAGQKKKLRYSPESTCFSEYYIGWIGIGNCGQETSNKYILGIYSGPLDAFNYAYNDGAKFLMKCELYFYL
jgi:hypothetical protein